MYPIANGSSGVTGAMTHEARTQDEEKNRLEEEAKRAADDKEQDEKDEKQRLEEEALQEAAEDKQWKMFLKRKSSTI